MDRIREILQRILNIRISHHRGPRLQRYGLVLLLLCTVFPLKFLIHQIFADLIAFYSLTFIVALSAWYGGLGPGILATILSALINEFFFIPPANTFTFSENMILTGFFIIEGLVISLISEARRRADYQKDEFIAFASHELKNPLTVAKSYANLIKQISLRKSEKKISEYAQIVESYINKTSDLVSDLLDMTKIEVGQLTFTDREFKIKELILGVIQDQSIVQKTHKIIFTGSSNKVIYGDEYRISQVLVNLISNAIKYSPYANVVRIKLKNSNNGVELSVRDFGIGMSNLESAKVFTRYYRSKKINNQKIEGLGIGLYITKQIVKRHKGKLWVKSQVGKGSTFFFYLPART